MLFAAFYDSIFKGMNQAWPLLSASIVLFHGSFLLQSGTIALDDVTVFMMYQAQVLQHMGGLVSVCRSYSTIAAFPCLIRQHIYF